MSETLTKDSVGKKDNTEDEVEEDSISNLSGSSASQDSKGNESNLQRDGGKITFMIGTSSPSSSVRYNKAFESDDNETVYDYKNVAYNPRRQRVYSDSMSDYSNSTAMNFIHNNLTAKAASEHLPAKNKKPKAMRVFKRIRNSIKSNKGDENNSNNISSDKPIGINNEENDLSDADSDGFVNYKYDDNDNYLANDVGEVVKTKNKRKIPVSESEDVNSIY